MAAILVTNCDDWEGLYIDGVLVEQNHRVNFKRWVKHIDNDFTEVEVCSEWTHEVGHLPDNYKDIPEEVFL